MQSARILRARRLALGCELEQIQFLLEHPSREGSLLVAYPVSDLSGLEIDLHRGEHDERLCDLYSFPSGTWTVAAAWLNLFDSNELQKGNGEGLSMS